MKKPYNNFLYENVHNNEEWWIKIEEYLLQKNEARRKEIEKNKNK